MTTSKLQMTGKRLEPVKEADLLKLHEELSTFDLQVSKELRLLFLTFEEKEVVIFASFEEDKTFDIVSAHWLLP